MKKRRRLQQRFENNFSTPSHYNVGKLFNIQKIHIYFHILPLNSFLYLFLVHIPYCCVSFQEVDKKSVHPKLNLAFPNCHCVHSSLFVCLDFLNYILCANMRDLQYLHPWSLWCHGGIQEQIRGWERSWIPHWSLFLLYYIGQSKHQEQLLNTFT